MHVPRARAHMYMHVDVELCIYILLCTYYMFICACVYASFCVVCVRVCVAILNGQRLYQRSCACVCVPTCNCTWTSRFYAHPRCLPTTQLYDTRQTHDTRHIGRTESSASAYTRACVRECVRECVRTCVRACVYVHMHAWVCVCGSRIRHARTHVCMDARGGVRGARAWI